MRPILTACAAIAIAACQPSASTADNAAPAQPQSTETSAENAPPASTEEPSTEEPSTATPSPHFDGPILGVDHPGEARHLRALIPLDEGHLLVGAEESRRGTQLRTWVLPKGPQSAPLAPAAEQNVPHRANSPLQIVAIPGVGAYALRATDSLGVPGRNASLTLRQIQLDGSIEEVARTIEIPDWRMRSTWTATRLGDEALVCFAAGSPLPGTDEAAEVLACGLLAFDGTWSIAPIQLAESAAAQVSLIAPFTGGGDADHALVSWVDPGNEGHVMGCVATIRASDAGTRSLACTPPGALTHRPLGVDPAYTHRRTPVFMSTEGGLVYVLPATATLQAQAGGVAFDGSPVGPVRDVIMLAGLLEAPRMVHGIRAPVMLYDSVGQDGERTAIVFLPDGVLVSDLVGMFGPGDPRGQSRLGPTSENVGSFVYTNAEGQVAILLREMERL